MASSGFNPQGYFKFDFESGTVATAATRVLMLSDSVVGPLVSAAVENGDLTPVRRLGRHIGEQARMMLGVDNPDPLPAHDFLNTTCLALGLYGWGKLTMERWGDALVLHAEQTPQLDPDSLGIAALLGGMLSSALSAEVACVPVGENRYMVVAPVVAEQVWNWARDGVTVGELASRLRIPEEKL